MGDREQFPWRASLAVLLVLISPAVGSAQIDQQLAATYFAEAAALCDRDRGQLWGVSLCGPMVFADPATGTIATNQPAPAASRPPALGFVNAPLDWGGTPWSAYVWSMLPAENKQERGRLLIHELFHRVQSPLGLMAFGASNDHLDTLEGRYWLQLEWRALSRALGTSAAQRNDAIRDALAFRAMRRSLFEGSAQAENALEIREGLAQYTGTVVSASSRDEAIADAIKQLTEGEKTPTFVRTFGYPSGAAYGLLLDASSPGWTRRVKSTDDLGRLLMEASRLAPTENARTAATRYDGARLRADEEKKDVDRQVRIAELRKRFIDGPILVVPRGRNASVITTGATPIPGHGTVFFEYRVTGEWGSLESRGMLESSDNTTLRLEAPFTQEGSTLTGTSWKVTLAPGWIVRPGARTGDFEVVRAPR